MDVWIYRIVYWEPYNDLPLLPPEGDLETKDVLKKLANAKSILCELKGWAIAIPNQDILINNMSIQKMLVDWLSIHLQRLGNKWVTEKLAILSRIWKLLRTKNKEQFLSLLGVFISLIDPKLIPAIFNYL